MPRFTLSNLEQQVLSAALVDYANANGLRGGDALVAAAGTTMAELHAVATQFLNAQRAKLVTQRDAIPTASTAATTALNDQIAAIDSALLKV